MASFAENRDSSNSPIQQRILNTIHRLSDGAIPAAFIIKADVIVLQSGTLPGEYSAKFKNDSRTVTHLEDGPLKPGLQTLLANLESNEGEQSVDIDERFQLVGSELDDEPSRPLWLVLLKERERGERKQDSETQPTAAMNHGMRESMEILANQFTQSQSISAPLIWESGLDKGLTYLCQNTATFTGRPVENLLGTGWTGSLHPDDADRVASHYSCVFDNRETLHSEYRLRRFDGEYHWFLELGVPQFDHRNEFRGYFGFCIDITKSKQVEIELLQKRRQLELAFSGTSIGIWEASVEDKDWIEASDIERMLDVPVGEFKNSRKRCVNGFIRTT